MFASLVVSVVALISSYPSALAFVPTRPLTGHATSLSSPATHATSIDLRNGSNRIQNAPHKQTSIHILSSTNDPEDETEEEKKKRLNDQIFWAKQQAFAAQMSANTDASLKQENQDKFAKRALALTSDTFYFSILISSLLWLVSSNPFVTISYLFGALSGTAYSYGLGKYVETIGGSIDDTAPEGAGIGQARFAFLILLFVVVGKFRSQGLLEIPSIMGFFTYQLASLGQGLREIDD
ncbi:hypothetical protein ACHAXR_003750 [Thalassiosira sp. AJA248-18]